MDLKDLKKLRTDLNKMDDGTSEFKDVYKHFTYFVQKFSEYLDKKGTKRHRKVKELT